MATRLDGTSNRYRDQETGRFISFRTEARIQTRLERLRRTIERANEGWLNAVGYLISTYAKRSIKRSRQQSRPGDPPTTRRGLLRRAIRYRVAQDRTHVLVGPTASKVGRAGEAHEHGGRYKGQRYPQRPFMGPALEQAAPQIGPRYKI
jgi:hypothetical protein